MSETLNSKPVRGLIAVAGFCIAGFSLALVVTVIAQYASGSTGDPGAAGAAICMLVTGAVGAAMCVWGYRGFTADATRASQSEVETRVLEVASAHDGQVTVPMIAAETELSLSDSEALLDRLAREGFVRMDIEQDGDTVYAFSGLDDSETELDQDSLESELARIAATETAVHEDQS